MQRQIENHLQHIEIVSGAGPLTSAVTIALSAKRTAFINGLAAIKSTLISIVISGVTTCKCVPKCSYDLRDPTYWYFELLRSTRVWSSSRLAVMSSGRPVVWPSTHLVV